MRDVVTLAHTAPAGQRKIVMAGIAENGALCLVVEDSQTFVSVPLSDAAVDALASLIIQARGSHDYPTAAHPGSTSSLPPGAAGGD
jgi:hypothetical protein